ncbi:MAG: tRNA dihydrouridine synthase [Lachnospiraceae bacterium]
MKYYMAPMEGLTGYVYRNAYHKFFRPMDRYFTPFIANKKMSNGEIRDLLPEHNEGMHVVPQILTNRSEDFLAVAKEIAQYGYDTVNLNVGCPSGTVVAKGRGAGLLAEPEVLDHFLYEIFEGYAGKISIRTRIGMEDENEWQDILAVYEKYPLEELIIHPRVRKDFYKGNPRLDAFSYAMEESGHRLCYNGDICSAEDLQDRKERFPDLDRVMLGRGLLCNPFLIEMSKTADDAAHDHMQEKKDRLYAFHQEILEGYIQIMSGDRNVLFRMKELWFYLGNCFTNADKYLKKIKKSERLVAYQAAVDALFHEQELR